MPIDFPSFRGVWPMLVTPFDPDGSVDMQSVTRLLDHILSSGVDGIAACGLASETHALSDSERRAPSEADDPYTHTGASPIRRCADVVGLGSTHPRITLCQFL